MKPTTPTPLEAFQSALLAEPAVSVRKTKDCVIEALPVIDENLKRGVDFEKVRVIFNKTYGTSIGLPRFRQLVRAARAADKVKSSTEAGDLGEQS